MQVSGIDSKSFESEILIKKINSTDTQELIYEDQKKPDEKMSNRIFFEAIEKNNLALLKRFIDCGTDITVLNSEGFNALHYASSILNIKAMEMLLSSGKFDIEAKTKSPGMHAPLMSVCMNSENQIEKALEAVALLVKFGANLESVDSDYFTPLAAAVYIPNYTLVEYLLKLGANPNARVSISDDNNTILHLAMISCQREIIKILIDHGADHSEINGWNRAPIHEAAYQNCIPGLRELILTRKVDKNTRSPMQEEKKFIPENENKCIFKATPLHYTAAFNSFKAMEFLLLIRAELHAVDELKRSALMYASMFHYRSLYYYLGDRLEWEILHPTKQNLVLLIRICELMPSPDDESLYQHYRGDYLHNVESNRPDLVSKKALALKLLTDYDITITEDFKI